MVYHFYLTFMQVYSGLFYCQDIKKKHCNVKLTNTFKTWEIK